MVDIPSDVCNGIFDKDFKRGSVIRTLFRGDDKIERPHYFILLNHDISSDPLIFVTSTSKLGFYDKHPHFNKDIIRLPAKKLSFFPRDTIIDCRRIYRFQKEKLKKNFRNNTLQFAGDLSPQLLESIDEIIKQSYFISKKDKDAILGANPASC